MVTGKQLLFMKRAIAMLNECFPQHPVSTILYGKPATVLPKPKFCAYYKHKEGFFWIMITDFWIWQDTKNVILDIISVAKQEANIEKIVSCFAHPIQYTQMQQDLKLSGVGFFIA